jgi:hypothetical protein
MNAPKFPVLQNFTGEPESDPAKIRANLVSQVAGSVRWDTCVRVMAERFGAERFARPAAPPCTTCPARPASRTPDIYHQIISNDRI